MGLPRRQIHFWPRSGTGGNGGWAGPDPAPRRLRLLVRPVLRQNGAVDGAGGLDVVGWPVGEIEGAMALGLSRRQIVRFVAPRAARSALIP